MKYIYILFLFTVTSLSYSQKSPKALRITYEKFYLGKITDADNPIVCFTDAETTRITNKSILEGKSTYPTEQTIIDRKTDSYVSLAQLNETNYVSSSSKDVGSRYTFELLDETKNILGYKCHKAKTVINSNTIIVWYTTETGLKGGPSVLGQNLGLVLETVRNNDYIVRAIKVEKLKDASAYLDIIPENTEMTNALSYRDIIWKSRFTTIPVFNEETINFSNESVSNDSILRFAKGNIVLKKVKLPLIEEGSQVFADLTEQSNGDAYDRTGSVFIIPTDRQLSFLDGLKNGVNALPIYNNGNGKEYQGVSITNNYIPTLELMRFFTPFGIKQYNHIELKDKTWHTIVPYRQDISELISQFSNKEVWIGAFIANYDKGGHKISLNLTIHPDNTVIKSPSFALPLFNTVNIMEAAGQEYATMFNSDKGLEVTFTLKNDIKNARLRYITTGHGGWENGDEFLPKRNSIKLDGNEIFSFIPWRQDCGSYRLFNPASGNFENGLSSSDYSRSNWCPGTLTNPQYIEIGDLKAGTHTIQVLIPQGAPEGGSFSSWNVSGVLLGD